MNAANKLAVSLFAAVVLTIAWNTTLPADSVPSPPTTETFPSGQPLDENDRALLDAAWAGDLPEVARLLDEGAHVNAANDQRLTPLILASFQGHADVVKLLLQRGADRNAVDEHGQTAQVHAVNQRHEEVARILEGSPGLKLMGLTSKSSSFASIPSIPNFGIPSVGNKYYTIFYSGDAKNKAIAEGLLKYAGDAYDAARSVIGADNKRWRIGSQGYMQQDSKIQPILVWLKGTMKDGEYGYTPQDSNEIYINLSKHMSYGKYDYKAMASTLAHETTHVLFSTNAFTSYWNKDLSNSGFKSIITEALAYYTEEVVYKWGPKYTKNLYKKEVQKRTKALYGDLNTMQTWWGAGNAYKFGGSAKEVDLAGWTISATGYFLAYGKSTQVAALIKAFRDSVDIGSSNFDTARKAWEQAFYDAYGKKANAQARYGNSGWDTRYLLGDYAKMFL